ncbi:MAG: M16 family metallopeptidase [Alphaproteobacteria bacterium]
MKLNFKPGVILLALTLLLAEAAGAADAPVAGANGTVGISRVISPGGIEAWLVSDHSNPVISVRLAFRGGAALDADAKPGLARMAAALLDEGAGDFDSKAFQRRLEDLSITLRFDAGRDHFTGRLKTLTENREQAFEMLRLALSKPRFDAEPVERIRMQLSSSVRQEMEDPDSVAGRALSRVLYPDHAYGRPVNGTLDSLQAIEVADLRGFASERQGRDNVYIGVVGDIGADDLSRLLDKVFGELPAKAKPVHLADVEPKTNGGTSVVALKVPQSGIMFAQVGLKRDDPEFFTAYVMNHILGGGGFTSRLYDEVREKRGLAYSIVSYLYPLDHSAMILGAAGTANARVAETIEIIRAQWRKMSEHGVTPEQLSDAKTYLTGSYPLRFTASGSIAGMLVGIQLENLGIDYMEKRNGYVEAVTVDGVNRLAAKLLDADKLTFVVAGQPVGVETTP